MKNNQNKMNMAMICWLFVVGCLIGYVIETLWHLIKNGEWINKQGLLYGPFKPIYGFGLIIIIIAANKLKCQKYYQKFLLGLILGSAFEYLASIFQEYILGTSTWNYANFSYNIDGRLYLPYCLAWGLIAIVCIDIVYPSVAKVIDKIPIKAYKIISIIMIAFMIINLALTSLATIRYADRAKKVENDSLVYKIIDNLYPDDYMKTKFPKLRIIEN